MAILYGVGLCTLARVFVIDRADVALRSCCIQTGGSSTESLVVVDRATHSGYFSPSFPLFLFHSLTQSPVRPLAHSLTIFRFFKYLWCRPNAAYTCAIRRQKRARANSISKTVAFSPMLLFLLTNVRAPNRNNSVLPHAGPCFTRAESRSAASI